MVTEREPGRKIRWRPKPSYTIAALVIVVIVGFILFRLSQRSKLQAQLDVIRAAGYPASCAELDQWYSIPDDAGNAAYTYLKAFSYFQQWTGKKREQLPILSNFKMPGRTEALGQDTKAVIAEYLDDNQQSLQLLHDASHIPHSRYPGNYASGLSLQFPHLNEIRNCSTLLQLEAILAAENNRSEAALSSIKSAFALAHSLSREPLLISQLVRIACQNETVKSLERVINRIDFGDDELSQLGRELINAQDTSSISRAFVGELCQGIEIFKNPNSQYQIYQLLDGSARPATRPLLMVYHAVGLSDSDAIVYVKMMWEYIKASQLPLQERRKAAEQIAAKYKTHSKIHILLRALFSPGARITELELINISKLRTALAATAVQRYRLANGSVPKSLTELVPEYLDEVPKDPFDGKELRYERPGTGFIVYSIGKDGKDNGGKEEPPRSKRKKTGNYDIPFIVER